MGSLFKGIKFWIAQRCPMRSSFIDQITSNGGEVVPLEKQADVLIVDHARKDVAPGTHSYTFIEQSIRKGELEDLDDHIAGPAPGSIRPVGSLRPTKGGRVPFTAEDDRILTKWVWDHYRKGGKALGNEIYKQLEAVNNRHTWQSWRDRYVKYLSPPSRVPENAPPTPPSDMSGKPASHAQNSPSASSRVRKHDKLKHAIQRAAEIADSEASESDSERTMPLKEEIQDVVVAAGVSSNKPWAQADFKDLLKGARNIEDTSLRDYRKGWVMWAGAWTSHTAEEWREFYEKVVAPIHIEREAQAKLEGSAKGKHKPKSQQEASHGTSPVPEVHKKKESASERKASPISHIRMEPVAPESLEDRPSHNISSTTRTSRNITNVAQRQKRQLDELVQSSRQTGRRITPNQDAITGLHENMLWSITSPGKKRINVDTHVSPSFQDLLSPRSAKKRRTDTDREGPQFVAADDLSLETTVGRPADDDGDTHRELLSGRTITFERDQLLDEKQGDGTEPEEAELPFLSVRDSGEAFAKNISSERLQRLSPLKGDADMLAEASEGAEEEPAVALSPFSSMRTPSKAHRKNILGAHVPVSSPIVEGVEMLDEIVGELDEEDAATVAQALAPILDSTTREELLDAGLPGEASPALEVDLTMVEPDDDWHQISSSVEDFESAREKAPETLSSSAQQLQDELVAPVDQAVNSSAEFDTSGAKVTISSEADYVDITNTSPFRALHGVPSSPPRQSSVMSQPAESEQPSSPPAAALVNLDTQAFVNIETQYFDFDVPEPEGGFGESIENEVVMHPEERNREAEKESSEEEDTRTDQEREPIGPDEDSGLVQAEEHEHDKERIDDYWHREWEKEMREAQEDGVEDPDTGNHEDESEADNTHEHGGGDEEEKDGSYENPILSRNDRNDLPPSPITRTSGQIPTAHDPDAWMNLQYLRGYTEDEIAHALLRTSLQLNLAEEVLVAVKSGRGLPRGMRGVWTDRDDEVLQEADSGEARNAADKEMLIRNIRRLEEKHGVEGISARRQFLDMRRDVEGEDNGG